MKLLTYALPALLCLLVACGPNKVAISYKGSFCDKHTVKIDDTLLLKSVKGTLYPSHTLFAGKHTLTIDGGKPETFEISDSCILNIAHEEFVIFPIKYSTGKDHDNLVTGMTNVIQIDSFVVGRCEAFEELGKGLKKTKLDGWPEGIDRNQMRLELEKTDSNKLVIAKQWDFSIDEKIPVSINKLLEKGFTNFTTYKLKVAPAKAFLLYAHSSSMYTAKPFADLPD